jgi:hypothetical protein
LKKRKLQAKILNNNYKIMKSPEMGMGLPESPKQEQSKIFISENWPTEERRALLELMNKKIEELNAGEAKERETCKWEAPYFKEIARKREDIQDLAAKLKDEVPSEFLEANRRNFKDFILHV